MSPGNRGQAQCREEGNEGSSSTGRIPSSLGTSHSFPAQTHPAQLREGFNAPLHSPQQQHGPTGASPNDESFAMASMTASLPTYRPSQPFSAPQGGQEFPTAVVPNMTAQQRQQSPQMPQFAGQSALNPGPSPNFPAQYAQSFQQMHQTGMTPPGYMVNQQGHHQQGSTIPAQLQQPFQGASFYPGQAQQSPQYFVYPPVYGQLSPNQGFQDPQHQIPSAIPGGAGRIQHSSMMGSPYSAQSFDRSGPRPNVSPAQGPIPSTPRGPPRKPKQSGYALWVGNLPPGAQVQDLKDHFSKDATTDIESVFLISKSNCAFVNYRTEEACAAAMTRFHDSRFQGVRLVCRLRRNSAAPTAPSPSTPTGPIAPSSGMSQAQTAVEAITQNRETSLRAEESIRQSESAAKINDKYFIVKSLTVEDLELSARNGIWATQAHNEEALNKAFESVDNVYLIFSANKSGEYFGYARMASKIGDESAVKANWTPQGDVVTDDAELPRSIPTPATLTAPKGRIIDDSARGTIFWEADPIYPTESPRELAVDGSDADAGESEEDNAGTEDIDEPQSSGKPFRIEWVSTNRLPFYRTRGLKNPWNGNRDVKIARDGTELETGTGRRLVQMFHRPSSGPAGHQFMPPGASG